LSELSSASIVLYSETDELSISAPVAPDNESDDELEDESENESETGASWFCALLIPKLPISEFLISVLSISVLFISELFSSRVENSKANSEDAKLVAKAVLLKTIVPL
jgi:hypothetical protein